ncbi:MAG: DUF4389 domain-containing protein [Woeseiaceae bacterium]|nr:DUF4389 domain-containing protein [Woeseiaceae bacterium]
MTDATQPRDHAPGDNLHDDTDDVPNSSSLEQNVKSKATWLRLFFILVFAFLYFVSRVVLFAVVLLQFFWLLFNGVINEPLRALGQSLATYTYQIVRFLTFNTNVRPFPFDTPWPPSMAIEDAPADADRKD